MIVPVIQPPEDLDDSLGLPDTNIIEPKIRYYRKKRGFTMQQLAEAVGTSQQQIDRLEKGHRRLTIEWLHRLSDVLECDFTDLLPSTYQKRVFQHTIKAKVIGAVMEDGEIDWFMDSADMYSVLVGRPTFVESKRLFALRTQHVLTIKNNEGETRSLPAESELIFAEVEEGQFVLPAGKLGLFKQRLLRDDGPLFFIGYATEDKNLQLKAVLVKSLLDEFTF